MELSALKVNIGKRKNGYADHPNFGLLPIVKASGQDWSHYVDEEGLGWHYDKTSGHRDHTAESPMGQQFGMLIVPEQFAIEAVAQFPAICTRLTELECQDFYDNKAHIHEPDDIQNDRIITGLKDTLDLMERTGAKAAEVNILKSKIKKALDPNDPEHGVKKNKRKKWADFKGVMNVTIKNPV